MGLTENLIQNELGCGKFQTMVVAFVYWLPMVPLFSSLQMMAFGSYNPGWSCDHNDSLHGQNANSMMSTKYGPESNGSLENNSNNTYWTYGNTSSLSLSSANNFTQFIISTNQTLKPSHSDDESCSLYERCQKVEFSLEASTIVTEFSLMCDKGFIPSLIISLQMVGVFVGSLFSGSLADMAGRKKTFYGSLFLIGLINAVSIFSISWEMFAVLRFLMGIFIACCLAANFIYSSEFVTTKWRAPLSGSPVWSVSGMIFGVLTMSLKDWQHFLALISILTFLCCLPCVWIPESLRWLEVKNKSKGFKDVVKKIARVNGKQLPRIDSKDLVTDHAVKMESDFSKEKDPVPSTEKMKKYTFADIFRPGYRIYSLTVATQWLSMSIIIFSIAFGVKALGGNFYINLILMNSMSIPFSLFPVIAPNVIGRKKAIFACFSLITLSLVCILALELFVPAGNGKNIGTLVLVMGVVAGIESGRAILVLVITEIYPTVVRGLAVSWGSLVSRIGAIIAPFLIPQDGSNEVYVWYSILAILGFICCCLVVGLPETKGKPLKETFDGADDNREHENFITADSEDTQAV